MVLDYLNNKLVLVVGILILIMSCKNSSKKELDYKVINDIVSLNSDIETYSSCMRCYFSEKDYNYDKLKYIQSLQSECVEVDKIYNYINYSTNGLGVLYENSDVDIDSLIKHRVNLCDILWLQIDTNSIDQKKFFYLVCDAISISDEVLRVPLYKDL